MKKKKGGNPGIKKKEIHSPTLNSILLVEKALEQEKDIGKYQLWKKLPKKMMYQTYSLILDYLEKSGKIKFSETRITRTEKTEETQLKAIICPAPRYVN